LKARRKKNIFCGRFNIQIFLYYLNDRAIIIAEIENLMGSSNDRTHYI
jgi:hypothetical protein